MFDDWVTAGGNLIAMRPDPDLAGLLGLVDAGTDLSDAYLQIDTGAGKPGAGLVGQTIQFHGTADRYSAGRGSRAARDAVLECVDRRRANPAVTLRRVGSNGGQAAAFTYDLARSVVYTRQGNPAWAGQERDGEQPPIIRSDDMFYPDWIDFSKVQIPQADEQQRLLANLIEHVNRDKMPLPRFWYFPRGEKAVVVMTGDDHASSGGTAASSSGRSPPAPQRATSRTGSASGRPRTSTRTRAISDAAAAAYEAEGFEIALHVNTELLGLDARLARRTSTTRSSPTSRPTSRASPRRPRTARTASPGATGRPSRRSSSTTASGSTRTTTTGRRRGSRTGPGISPARACRCASPTSTDR